MTGIAIDAFCPVGIGGTKGVDTTHLKLFVGGLSAHHTSKNLYDMFSSFGTIRESVVIPDRFRVRSRCYGFVTFVEHAAVSAVFQKAPIMAPNGNKLTVVLASANTKPRRAHFNVKHGVSGHKPLPMVKEEDDDEQCDGEHEEDENEQTNSCEMASAMSMTMEGNKRASKQPKNKYHRKQACVDSKGKIGIYTDPSLFRTANIQPIAPASFSVPNKAKNTKKEASPEIGTWPNDDIKKDFYHLNKVVVSERDERDRKSWKLIAVENEYDAQSYYSMTGSQCDEDDIYSVNSRKWTPLAKKRVVGDGNYHDGDRERVYHGQHPHPHQRQRQHGDGDSKWNHLRQQKVSTTATTSKSKCNGGGSKARWVRSPKKTAASSSSASSIDLTGNQLETEQDCKPKEEDEDRWTFASLFDGSYQNLLMDVDEALNKKKEQEQQQEHAQPAEMEELRDMFKHRMSDKISRESGCCGPVFNQNVNGMWSPYQPTFVYQSNYGGSSMPNTLPSPMAATTNTNTMTMPITFQMDSVSNSFAVANQVASYGAVGYVNMNGAATNMPMGYDYDQMAAMYQQQLQASYDSNSNLNVLSQSVGNHYV